MSASGPVKTTRAFAHAQFQLSYNRERVGVAHGFRDPICVRTGSEDRVRRDRDFLGALSPFDGSDFGTRWNRSRRTAVFVARIPMQTSGSRNGLDLVSPNVTRCCFGSLMPAERKSTEFFSALVGPVFVSYANGVFAVEGKKYLEKIFDRKDFFFIN